MNGTRNTPDQRIATGQAINPPAGVLGWLPPRFWGTIKEYFAYPANFLPLVANATQTETISIQSDSDFILLYATLVGTATDNVTPLVFRPALVQLRDASSGTDLFQSPTHVENVFGDAMQPGIFAVPYYLRANSALQVTLQNLEAFDRNYRLTFHGFKSWPNSDQQTGRLR
jgi:hypothetical protein